jgi:hypothetical protein
MMRARDTGFIPVNGGLTRVHRGQLLEDDAAAVLAAPGMFDPWVDPAPAAPRETPAPSAITAEPVDDGLPVIRDRRGRGRRG